MKMTTRACIIWALYASAVIPVLEPIHATMAKTKTCSALMPMRLDSEFSREQQQLLAQILPQATAVRSLALTTGLFVVSQLGG